MAGGGGNLDILAFLTTSMERYDYRLCKQASGRRAGSPLATTRTRSRELRRWSQETRGVAELVSRRPQPLLCFSRHGTKTERSGCRRVGAWKAAVGCGEGRGVLVTRQRVLKGKVGAGWPTTGPVSEMDEGLP